MRKCKKCIINKEIKEFRKVKKWFSHTCKKCYASKYRTGKPNLTRFKKGVPSPRKGVKLSDDLIEKMSIIRRNPNAETKGSGTFRYRFWREEVLKKSDYKCFNCGEIENLHCHHIKPWKTHIDLRFDVSNGMALCGSCHGKEEVKIRAVPGIETRFKKGHILSEASIKKMKKTKRENLLKFRITDDRS